MIAEATDEFLETKAPVPREWDPSKIKWEQAEGSKGMYERSEDLDNAEFKAMIKDLESHKGKMCHEGFFYWVFQNGTTVGRKKV